MSQVSLAILLGVSITRISQLERDYRPPIDRLNQIAGHLNVEPDALLAEYEVYHNQLQNIAVAASSVSNAVAETTL
jgi:transcriptional regulator with XRE-family HTH domain